MAPPQQKARSPVVEAALGFVLGAVSGCALGATEGPVNRAMAGVISGTLLRPVTDAVRTVGPLGLGTLLGATALTTAMTAAVMGVTVAASAALLLLGARRDEAGVGALGGSVWVAAGLAAALGTTACGAILGAIIEKLTVGWGLVALLWGLVIVTVLKPVLHVIVQFAWREREFCGILGQTSQAREDVQRRLEAMEAEQRERVTVQIEQRITALETDKGGEGWEGLEHRATWEAQRREREEMERQQREELEVENEQRTIQERINKMVAKYMEFLAFSGIPMTVTATVTAGFGIFGFGDYRFVFIVLLALVLCISFMLMKSMHLNFWMFTGCMGMFATFAIAVLTVHAGQEVAGMSVQMRMAGHEITKENISAQMNHRSSLEAIGAGFFVAKMCQVGLGATVGGPLGRQVTGKIIVGAAGTALAILSVVEVASTVLGPGGTTGALLGAVGAAGVSTGAAAAVAVGWSTWPGTVATTAGIIMGALAIGKWDIVNVGLQIPVVYIFAMTNTY